MDMALAPLGARGVSGRVAPAAADVGSFPLEGILIRTGCRHALAKVLACPRAAA
jgi:hypothetical protein